MLITADQIRAARALKNWSQTDLAERTGLAVPTIANIELGKQVPGKNTIEKIIDAFTLGGIDFTERGVEKKDEHSKFVSLLKKSDENLFISLIEDVLFTLSNYDDGPKEVLIMCGDDRISPPEINALYKKMRANGIAQRQISEQGNTYLLGALEEYRYIPTEYYLNNVTLIYGTKYAICLGNIGDTHPDEIIIVNDDGLAKIQRNIFEYVWSSLPKPKKSTASEKDKFQPVKTAKQEPKKKGRK